MWIKENRFFVIVQSIKTMIYEEQFLSWKKVKWNTRQTNQRTSKIYLVRMPVDNFTKTKKILLRKNAGTDVPKESSLCQNFN